jgi:protein PhnA
MEYPVCPQCKSANTYPFEDNYVCPDCAHEWSVNEAEEKQEATELVVKDANGVLLQNGDTVVTIKNLPVRGVAQTIKAGTKVKKIRLTDGDHNIDCKIDGFGAMALKSEFVKKV